MTFLKKTAILSAALFGFIAAAPAEEPKARFDLFGRAVNSEAVNESGSLPDKPLKIVVDRNAPRFGFSASRRKSSSSSRRARRPDQVVKLFGKMSPDNAKVKSSSKTATHMVKYGNRIFLKKY